MAADGPAGGVVICVSYLSEDRERTYFKTTIISDSNWALGAGPVSACANICSFVLYSSTECAGSISAEVFTSYAEDGNVSVQGLAHYHPVTQVVVLQVEVCFLKHHIPLGATHLVKCEEVHSLTPSWRKPCKHAITITISRHGCMLQVH